MNDKAQKKFNEMLKNLGLPDCQIELIMESIVFDCIVYYLTG